MWEISTLRNNMVFVKIKMCIPLYGLLHVLWNMLYPKNKQCIYYSWILRKLMTLLIDNVWIKF